MTLVKFNSDKNNNQRGLVPVFNDVFNSIFTDSFFTERGMSTVPAVNICENADHFQIELASPGLQKEDFRINLERKILTISVDKANTEEDQNKNYSRKEFSFYGFTRSFTLPDSADENHIEASYVDGVLKLQIAKREEAKNITRQISIS